MKKTVITTLILGFFAFFISCNSNEGGLDPVTINPFESLVATHSGSCIKTYRDLTVNPSKVKIDTTVNNLLKISKADANGVTVLSESCSALTGGYVLLRNFQTSTADSSIFEYASKGTTWTAEGKLVYIKSKKQILTSSRQLVSGDNETQYSAVYQLK